MFDEILHWFFLLITLFIMYYQVNHAFFKKKMVDFLPLEKMKCHDNFHCVIPFWSVLPSTWTSKTSPWLLWPIAVRAEMTFTNRWSEPVSCRVATLEYKDYFMGWLKNCFANSIMSIYKCITAEDAFENKYLNWSWSMK